MGFSGPLPHLDWKAPGQRQPGSVTPTPDGIPLAKDGWLLAIGLALLLAGSRRKGARGPQDARGQRTRALSRTGAARVCRTAHSKSPNVAFTAQPFARTLR